MSLAELKSKSVGDLRGAWTAARISSTGTRAQDTFLTSRASWAENVRYDNGRVIGRDGFKATGHAASGKVTSMDQWIAFDETAGDINLLVTFENGTIRVRNLISGGSPFTLETVAGSYGQVMVQAATRAYLALYTTALTSTQEVRYISPDGLFIAKAFIGPMSTAPVMSENGAGLVGGGTRKYAYIVTSKSGARLKPSPYLGAIFSPATFTSADNKTVRMTINATWPADAAFVEACMTTKENLEEFFLVPDSKLAVPGGSPLTVQMDISIDDATLAIDNNSLTNNFNYLTQSGGVGPFRPFNAVQMGNRIAYFTGVLTYISDLFDYEQITGDQHVVQLPGQRMMVTGCHIRGVNYFFGPKWTYASVDNEDVPATWASPYSVSQSQGTTAIHGVQVATTGDSALVANEAGLWDFNGAFADTALSKMNDPEWKRINWSVARYTLRIVDNTVENVIYVAVPLDTATDNSHILTWNYDRGRDPMQVDFSITTMEKAMSSIAFVRGWLSQLSQVWVGPPDATPILQQDVDTLGNDNGVAFTSKWESGLVFSRRLTTNTVDQMVQQLEATVKGTGTLLTKIYYKGRDLSEDLLPVVLEDLPDDEYTSGCHVISPDITVEFRTTKTGERMDLKSFTLFFQPWLTNR